MSYTLAELAELTNSVVYGDADCRITGVATLQLAQQGDISFLANRRYLRYLASTQASAVITSPDDQSSCPVNNLVSGDPYLAFVRIVHHFHPGQPCLPGISPSAVISDSAGIAPSAFIGAHAVIGDDTDIGENVYIGPGCVLGKRVTIAANTRLVANISICDGVSIGRRVILHPGVVIGADGFGIVEDDEKWLKIPQIGSVIIGDDVEIGANTTIDRGALGDTVIEQDVKIDNQVQIGHNVRIGAHTAIAGCVGVAGSASIGRNCKIGGMTAISGHIEIADNVIINGMTGVANSIKQAGHYGSAIPAMDARIWKKNVVRFKQLDDMVKRLKHLESIINKNK
jgi:UDP-3-O-[3-hydroxymyristoyl] glucosamine N-acyltransferase